VTIPLTEEMNPAITPIDADLEAGDKVAQVEASPCPNLDVVDLPIRTSATKGVACDQICGLLIEWLEDVSLFLSCLLVF
jgi:hypothetical protein